MAIEVELFLYLIVLLLLYAAVLHGGVFALLFMTVSSSIMIVCLVLVQSGRTRAIVLAAVLCACAGGVSLWNSSQPELPWSDYDDPILIAGSVISDARYIDSRTTIFDLHVSSITNPRYAVTQTAEFGEVTVIGAYDDMLYWGDAVLISPGRIVRLESGYMVYAVEIELLHDSGLVYRILQSRKRINQKIVSMFSGFPHSQRELCRLLLLGDTTDPDLPVKDSFRKAGCMHLLALSGMHVYVLASLIMMLASRMLSKQMSCMVSTVVVLLFVFYAGFQPSLIRAGIMYLVSSVYYVVKNFARLSVLSALGCSFVIQILCFPRTSRSISFQLSYAALFGIVLISKELSKMFPGCIPERVRETVCASAAAVMMTLPVTISAFHEIYPIGIIASCLLAPAVMGYMLLTILYILLSAVFPSGAVMMPFISGVYSYIETAVQLFCRFPSVPIPETFHIPALSGIMLLATIRFVCKYGRISQNRKRKQVYEYGISVRFTERNTRIT